jgi:hypothetical protein
MILPFIPENLFELNNNLQPQFDGETIIIDNIFKNYQSVLNVCNNMSVENWKISPTSRNFKDYYDCRPIFQNPFPNIKTNNRLENLTSLVKYYFKENSNIVSNEKFIFNYFKHLKKDISNNFQHHPHYDGYYNVIFYIDPFENGGTALYENLNLNNTEHENLLFNISNLKIKKIIKSKPNRCVIFSGHQLHGGYIKDHNVYYYNWRINLVNFLIKTNE